MGSLASLIMLFLYLFIPSIILYMIIKTAIKNAIRELKDDGIL